MMSTVNDGLPLHSMAHPKNPIRFELVAEFVSGEGYYLAHDEDDDGTGLVFFCDAQYDDRADGDMQEVELGIWYDCSDEARTAIFDCRV